MIKKNVITEKFLRETSSHNYEVFVNAGVESFDMHFRASRPTAPRRITVIADITLWYRFSTHCDIRLTKNFSTALIRENMPIHEMEFNFISERFDRTNCDVVGLSGEILSNDEARLLFIELFGGEIEIDEEKRRNIKTRAVGLCYKQFNEGGRIEID